MQGKLQSTLLFIRKIRIKVVAGMAWWCENAFPSLLQPAIQTSTAFTVNNRLTLTAVFFETGAMPVPTKSQNPTICGSGDPFHSYLTHS